VYLPSLFPFSFLPFSSFLFPLLHLFPLSEVLINIAAPQHGDQVTTSFFFKKTWLSQQRFAKIFPKTHMVGGWACVFAFALTFSFPFLFPSLFPFSEVLINVAAPQRGDQLSQHIIMFIQYTVHD
jgi:hypothetical protein